jgi:hypothetical protein
LTERQALFIGHRRFDSSAAHSILSSDSILEFRLISSSLVFVAAALNTKSVVFLRLSLSDVSSKLFEFDTLAATSAYLLLSWDSVCNLGVIVIDECL